MKILTNTLFGGCLLFPLCVYAGNTGPADTAKVFYQEYLQGNGSMPAKLAPYLDSRLIRSLNRWGYCESGAKGVTCSTECIKFSCNYDGIWIDHYDNYFTKTEKSWPTWSKAVRSSVLKKGESTATVKVVLGSGTDPTVSLKVAMRKVGEQWKIATVE